MLQPKRESKNTKKAVLWIIAVCVFLGAIGAGGYFYVKYKELKDNPEVVAKEEVQALADKVGKLITLPSDEEPTVATVQDKEKLKDQPFFKDAENGDKILIYTKAKKAITYRPSSNTLINVGPIAINDQQAQVGVAVLKGSGTADIEAAAAKVTEVGAIVASKGDAKNKTHKQTVVVDVSGSNGDLASKLAEKLGGKVTPMPSGEEAPSGAQIVVILAK